METRDKERDSQEQLAALTEARNLLEKHFPGFCFPLIEQELLRHMWLPKAHKVMFDGEKYTIRHLVICKVCEKPKYDLVEIPTVKGGQLFICRACLKKASQEK